MEYFFFFFNDTATTEIYTLSLHDALPISLHPGILARPPRVLRPVDRAGGRRRRQGRGRPRLSRLPPDPPPRPATHAQPVRHRPAPGRRDPFPRLRGGALPGTCGSGRQTGGRGAAVGQ